MADVNVSLPVEFTVAADYILDCTTSNPLAIDYARKYFSEYWTGESAIESLHACAKQALEGGLTLAPLPPIEGEDTGAEPPAGEVN